MSLAPRMATASTLKTYYPKRNFSPLKQRHYATEDNAQSFVMENSVESLKGGG